jgi:hypothetical protein
MAAIYARTFVNCSTADLARNRIAVKFFGGKSDEDAIARSEKALPDMIGIIEGQVAKRAPEHGRMD